jgi:uncharacterized protein (TIGR03083 family)
MLDLEPATRPVSELVTGLTEDQLAGPTPCERYTVGDLLDHVSGLAQAFVGAAHRDFGPGAGGAPSGDAVGA